MVRAGLWFHIMPDNLIYGMMYELAHCYGASNSGLFTAQIPSFIQSENLFVDLLNPYLSSDYKEQIHNLFI